MNWKTLISKEQWLLTISSGFFLFFVLFFYEGFGIPGGISSSGHGLFFRSASFGLITLILIFANEWLLGPRFRIQKGATIFLWYLWELVIVWHAIFLLINVFWDWQNMSWFGYFDLLGEISSVMIFPVILTELYKWIKRDQANAKVNEEKLVFKASNGKEYVSVSPQDFLYISSEDNYIDIHFLQNDEVKLKTIRSSLKRIEEEFKNTPTVVRCHRGYIINPAQIIHLAESSRANKVVLSNNIKIPVSDTYLEITKESILDSSSSHI